MKKIICAALLLGLASCGGQQNTSNTSQSELERELAAKDSLLNEVFYSLNEISANLNEIKDREGLITDNASMDASLEQQAQIFADIAAINALLERNKASLNRLGDVTEQLRRSNVQVKELETLISGFAKQIQDKDTDIALLRIDLENMKLLVDQLNVLADSLRSDTHQLGQTNQWLESRVDEQEGAINMVYYIIGRERDLRDADIVDKSGFIGRTVTMSGQYNLDKFTRVDRRNLERILVGQRRATIVTPHPAGSYTLEMGENNLLNAIIITDPERFWETSKILVISYK